MQKIVVGLIVAIGLVLVILALSYSSGPSSNNPNLPNNNVNCNVPPGCGPNIPGPDDPKYNPAEHGDVPVG
jgi:hypothetical protein